MRTLLRAAGELQPEEERVWVRVGNPKIRLCCTTALFYIWYLTVLPLPTHIVCVVLYHHKSPMRVPPSLHPGFCRPPTHPFFPKRMHTTPPLHLGPPHAFERGPLLPAAAGAARVRALQQSKGSD